MVIDSAKDTQDSQPNANSPDEETAEWVAEFGRRIAYIKQNYLMGARFIGGTKEQNAALRQIREAIEGKVPNGKRTRINPMVEMVLSEHARKFAAERTGEDGAEIECGDIKRALEKTAELLKIKRGAPAFDNLRRHVEGMAVLIKQMSGKPVAAAYYRGTEDYEPHFKPGLSQLIPEIFLGLEPSATVIKLVTIVLEAQRDPEKERLKFADYFPLYGARAGPDGSLELNFGLQLETFVPNVPIYFPVPDPA